MLLFKHIEDKDVFQTFCTIKLSKRLIHRVSASDESEANMISKLKEACGFEYTPNRLQRMLTLAGTCSHQIFHRHQWKLLLPGVNLSRQLTDQFKEHRQQNYNDMDINFSIMVLGKHFWPLSAPHSNFVIPADIQLTHDRFQGAATTKSSIRAAN